MNVFQPASHNSSPPYQTFFPTDEVRYIKTPPYTLNKSSNWQNSAANVVL